MQGMMLRPPQMSSRCRWTMLIHIIIKGKIVTTFFYSPNSLSWCSVCFFWAVLSTEPMFLENNPQWLWTLSCMVMWCWSHCGCIETIGFPQCFFFILVDTEYELCVMLSSCIFKYRHKYAYTYIIQAQTLQLYHV